MKTHSLRFGGLAALVMVLSAPVVYAAEAVLMDGGQVTITEQDMHADALRMPLEMRERVLARPDQVAQIASNLYVRRSLAQQADAAGLASNPETKAALQIARDKVLSDALLAKIDKDNALPDAKLEGLARSNYNANPDRFKVAEQVQVRHILIASPDDAGRAKAAQVLVDLQGGADFAALAKEFSDASDAAQGGEMGLMPANRYPELFLNATARVAVGGVTDPVRSGAGFHVLKVLGKAQSDISAVSVVQNHARHILLRTSAELSEAAAAARLADYRKRIDSGLATFQALAQEHSQDSSAAQGGDLGWSSPGRFVPEFAQALDALQPGQISQPVVSRFGVHLIQLVERRSVNLSTRELREVAREAVRQKKREDAYIDWAREQRARAYVEIRAAPQDFPR